MFEYNLLIKHDMGYKYSFLVKEVYRNVIEDAFHMGIKFIVTENSLALKIMNTKDSYQSSDILFLRWPMLQVTYFSV